MFNSFKRLEKNKALQLSPITLAFIGDAVHSLFVKEKLVNICDDKGAVLNKKASNIVRASAQANFFDEIESLLNEDEIAVYKRARNAKKGTRAKNATVHEYNKATGFEAVVGYLYLIGEIQRLESLLNYEKADNNNEN